jgi:hypothetical protein
MNFLKTTSLTNAQKGEIHVLWNREYPVNLHHSSLSDFKDYLKNLHESNHVLLLDNEAKIKGWYCGFVRESEPWFVMILNASIQRKGWGGKLLDNDKQDKKALNGWVIDHRNDKKLNGEDYPSPLDFYQKNGFEVLTNIRLELNNISAVKIRWTSQSLHSQ